MAGIAGKTLFGRAWAVTINTVKITGLNINFKVEKSTKDEPNTCELHVWNLSEDHRAMIEELNPATKTVSGLAKAKVKEAVRKQATKGIPCKIEVGYEDDLQQIWLGDLRSGHSLKHEQDWQTILESGDGEKSYQNARVNVSYGPKTPTDTALRAIARAMGVGEGNLSATVAKLRTGGKLYPQGSVFSGPARDHMSAFCKSADLEWSIQDGALQFLDRGKALDGRAIRLSSDTGMLDSPTVDVDGILTIKSLILPDVRPGRLLVVDAARVKGNYKIEKCTWEGDSASDKPFTITMQAKRY